MKLFTFVFINFVVSFISDIVLNDLANPPQPFVFQSEIIRSLQPYFKQKSIIIAGIYAGITICLSLLLVCFISKILFRFYVLNNLLTNLSLDNAQLTPVTVSITKNLNFFFIFSMSNL